MSDASSADHRAAVSSRRLGRVTALTLMLLLAAAVVFGGVVSGRGGAASAALGVGLTGVLFGGGLLSLHRTSAGSRSFAPVVVAFALRIVLYASALALVTQAEWVHGASLSYATAASIAVMLAVGLVAVAREPVAELEPLGRQEQRGADDTST